jgi:hypothetical protein
MISPSSGDGASCGSGRNNVSSSSSSRMQLVGGQAARGAATFAKSDFPIDKEPEPIGGKHFGRPRIDVHLDERVRHGGASSPSRTTCFDGHQFMRFSA